MHLTILRHAQAEDGGIGLSDFDRCLTDKGHRQSAAVGRFFLSMGWKPDAILTSPLVRAQQTAEGVCQAADLEAPIVEKFLHSGMSPQHAAEGLEDYQHFRHIVIVGHEPDLSSFLAWMIGSSSLNLQVSKASFWGVECTSLSPGRGILTYALPHSLLKSFAV